MVSELYLDTARLGRMCRGARKAEQDFCWLVSRLGSSLYLEQFLSDGFEALPPGFSKRLTGLRCWRGIAGFAAQIRGFLNASNEAPVFLFSQSSSLVDFAATSLFDACSKVMVTDLCWPPYLDKLTRKATAMRSEICIARISGLIHDGMNAAEIVEVVREQFASERCDGLFISDISYLGYRLPASSLISTLSPKFSVVDGAQAFGQRPVNLSRMGCDLYLAGTQKWLGAYHPLRMAICGRSESAAHIQVLAVKNSARSADSLFRFSEQLRSSKFPPFGETAHVAPLISSAGALLDSAQRQKTTNTWDVVRVNAQIVRNWLDNSSWTADEADASLSSGIVRVRPDFAPKTNAQRMRKALAEQSIVATTYNDGAIRLSMPFWQMSLQHMTQVRRALNVLES